MEWNFSNLLACFIFLFLITLLLILNKKQTKLPPGPPGWPVIGNIFDFGSIPHQTLYKLRFKYGHLLWLRLGFTDTLVIQTAKAAEQLFKNHDISFADRKVPEAFSAHNFKNGSLTFNSYGSVWRSQRRLVTTELMSKKKLNDSVSIRRNCIDKMIEFIEEDVAAAITRGESGEIEIGHYVFVMTYNVIGNLVFSRDLVNSQSEEGIEFFHAMDKVLQRGEMPNLADFFPFLKVFDPQKVKKNMEIELGRTMSIVKKFVMERIEDKQSMKERETKDFLDAVLEYDGKEGHDKISTHNVLILIVEMFFGGKDTTTGTIEWVMAELFRNPNSMRRVREELNRVVGTKRKVEESDIDELPYLQAVIKEAMRLHPMIPFLVPRNTVEDTELMGYVIPKHTRVLVNVWGIGRDPDAWDDPLSFRPERFLGSDIDYKGQDFGLLPFGSGRRICVGFALGHRIVHLTVASLLHNFDWEIVTSSTSDMNERMGAIVRKLIPLKAIPKKIISK